MSRCYCGRVIRDPGAPYCAEHDDAPYPTSRTSSAGTDRMYRPLPHSWSSVKVTDARQPSSHRTQPSIHPGTQTPSWSTSTRRGSSKWRTRSDTVSTVGGVA